MKLKYILLFVPLLLATACGTGRKTASNDAAEALQFDKNQVWQLVSERGKEVELQKPEVILMFHPESGTLRGRVACNRYFADYTLRLNKVTPEGSRYNMKVMYVSGGDVQCPEGGMAEQERYLALLSKADACLLTPYSLTLFQRGKETLKFELQ